MHRYEDEIKNMQRLNSDFCYKYYSKSLEGLTSDHKLNSLHPDTEGYLEYLSKHNVSEKLTGTYNILTNDVLVLKHKTCPNKFKERVDEIYSKVYMDLILDIGVNDLQIFEKFMGTQISGDIFQRTLDLINVAKKYQSDEIFKRVIDKIKE